MKRIGYFLFMFSLVSWMLVGSTGAATSNLSDGADILTDGQEQTVYKKMMDLKETYGIDIAIVTTASLAQNSIDIYADQVFEANGYGTGDEKDGIMFLISMEDGNHQIYTKTSGKGIDYITNYGRDYIGNHIKQDLTDEKYEKACLAYLDYLDEFIKEAKENKAYSYEHKYSSTKDVLIVCLIIVGVGILIGLTVVCIMKYKMKNVRPNRFAREYVRPGSMMLRNSSDIFLYSSVSKTRKATNNDQNGNNGGGGGISF